MSKRFLPLVLLILLSALAISPVRSKPSEENSPAGNTDTMRAVGADNVSTGKDPLRRTLKVAVMEGPPWCMRDEDGHWTGMTIDLLRELAEELHVDYDFKESNLAGVQDMVQRKEVDLSGAGLAITAEREARFDFSDPYCVFNQTVAVNADQQASLFDGLRSTLLSWGFLAIVLSLIAITLVGAVVFWLLEQRGLVSLANTDRKSW